LAQADPNMGDLVHANAHDFANTAPSGVKSVNFSSTMLLVNELAKGQLLMYKLGMI